MSGWYIDRSRNISSIVSSIHYGLLKNIIDSPLYQQKSIDTQDLIEELQIDGANKNALLTNFRDLGLLNTTDNKPSSFFITCTKANISPETIVLLILLKRNDEKKASNKVKPFVVMAKALSMMINNGTDPILTWGLCDSYLMKMANYGELTWDSLHWQIKHPAECLATPVLDIWFNALIATGLFEGDKKKVKLKADYYSFIKFISRYGDEMEPSANREEYVSQACDATYGWYNLFKAHTYEAVCSLMQLPELIKYVQTVDGIDVKVDNDETYNIENKPKNELEKELEFLKKQERDIQQKIRVINNRLATLERNQEFLSIKTNPQNKELFSFYLKENRGLCDKTRFDYFRFLEKAKDLFKEKENIVLNTEIYFIQDLEIVAKLISIWEANEELVEANKKSHYSFSAAYNNYYEFLKTILELG